MSKIDTDIIRAVANRVISPGFEETHRDTLLAAADLLDQCRAAGFITPKGEVVERPVAGVTADGVAVRVGQPVYRATPTHIQVLYAQADGSAGASDCWASSVERYHSTREAAEAARSRK